MSCLNYIWLQPGKTDKHVFMLLPRETFETMAIETDARTGSIRNVVVGTSLYNIGNTDLKSDSSGLCLAHSAKKRGELNKELAATSKKVLFAMRARIAGCQHRHSWIRLPWIFREDF